MSKAIQPRKSLREVLERNPLQVGNLMHDLRFNGIRSMRSVQGLLWWNFISVFLVLIPTVLPSLGEILLVLRYIMFSAVLCTAFSWWRLGARIKMIWPIGLILVLQMWLTVTSFISGVELGRTNDFESSNYFLVMAVIYYFMGAVFGHYWTGLRRLVPYCVVGLFFISALVGLAQFLRLPPALHLASVYNTFGNIDNWGGGGGVRAIGLASWPEWLTWQCLFSWAVVVSPILRRPLYTWEFVLGVFFIMVSFMPQSRILYVSVIGCVITFGILLLKFDRKRAPALVSVFAVATLGLFTFGQEQLGYVLNTDIQNDRTLQYRRETGWHQGYFIYDERPWVGVGPDNDLVWEVRQAVPDKWIQGQFLDNGYLLLISWGGLPALAIFIFVMFSAVGGAIMVLRDRKVPLPRKELTFVILASVLFIWNNTILNNGFTNIWLNCLICYLAGLAQPNSRELEQEKLDNRILKPALVTQGPNE